jgi:hypothetical protein
MNRKRILLSNMVVFSLLFSARACPVVVPGTGTLTLKLTKTTDDKTVLPGATVYMAKLFNNTDRTVTVEAIQTAGEYEGGRGSFITVCWKVGTLQNVSGCRTSLPNSGRIQGLSN